MAQNPALTQLLNDLNAAPHPGMGNDFFAHVGSFLALSRTVPPAWFPKTGTATEAQIGSLIANLHSLTTVAWGAYPLNGAANMTAYTLGFLEMVCAAAVALQQQEKRHARHWRVAEAQSQFRLSV